MIMLRECGQSFPHELQPARILAGTDIGNAESPSILGGLMAAENKALP
jgi:hypothetical protein